MSAPRIIEPGVCRICGCTDELPCMDLDTDIRCVWVDSLHTLCDNIECLMRVSIAELEAMEPARGR